MASLTTKQRKSLPKSEFALPATRQYPIDTCERAANAKARATQMFEAGKMTESQHAKVFAAANKVIEKCRKA